MAKKWEKDKDLKIEDGKVVEAVAPYIISASRSTDIPAFYADWFFNRLKAGYSVWRNPFNGVNNYVSYKNTRFIVFWSKNPQPLLCHLPYLHERGIEYYIQYTLNDYVDERLEPGVRPLQERIDTFRRLVDYCGVGRVIWRFDPLMLTYGIDEERLLDKVSRLADQLKGYTEKLVFSYADILSYKKVKINLENNHIGYCEWTENQMLSFARRLAQFNHNWGFQLATCGERIDLSQFGIEHNHCIDESLIVRFAWRDPVLMKFLGMNVSTLPIIQPKLELFDEEPQISIPNGAIVIDDRHYATRTGDNSDKGQRQYCGCIVSKDIGQYNTCPHQCEYCYANTSKQQALKNWHKHNLNPNSDTITG